MMSTSPSLSISATSIPVILSGLRVPIVKAFHALSIGVGCSIQVNPLLPRPIISSLSSPFKSAYSKLNPLMLEPTIPMACSEKSRVSSSLFSKKISRPSPREPTMISKSPSESKSIGSAFCGTL